MILLYYTWAYIRRNVSQHTIKVPDTPVYSRIIHNSQNVEATKCIVIDKRINTMWAIHTMVSKAVLTYITIGMKLEDIILEYSD
jgi:hypothetical protein